MQVYATAYPTEADCMGDQCDVWQYCTSSTLPSFPYDSDFISTGFIPHGTFDILTQYRDKSSVANRRRFTRLFSNSEITLIIPFDELNDYDIYRSISYFKLRGYSSFEVIKSPDLVTFPNVSNALHKVKDFFSLSISDLAKLAGVSRPTVYGYLQNKEVTPQEETRAKIDALYRYADKVNEIFTRQNIQVHRFIKRPISNGESLFDYMLREEDISGPLQKLVDILQEEQILSQDLVARFKDRPVLNAEEDVSMPLSRG